MISWEDFEKIDIWVGIIIDATNNKGTRIPAYALTIDFGPDLGIKKSSAQITQNYLPEDLISMKILAVVNFPPKKVSQIKSEVLVLATICEEKGTLLIYPDQGSIIGSRVK